MRVGSGRERRLSYALNFIICSEILVHELLTILTNEIHFNKYINMSDYQGCEWFSKRLANYMNVASRSLRGGREGFLHTASGVHCTYTLHMRVHRTTAYKEVQHYRLERSGLSDKCRS